MSARIRRGGPRLTRHVAPGVHRLEHAYVNCYLVTEGDAVTVVDAAFPATWAVLPDALRAIGRRPEDVAALVLTHAHFDHLGVANRLRTDWDVPIHAHPRETYLAAHPYRYAHQSPRLRYPVRYPRALPILQRMVAAGALVVSGIDDLKPIREGVRLDVPGGLHAVFSPGHTLGHCALHLPERDALISGDALVTLDPYTGWTGPRLVARAATADVAQARASLDALDATEAGVVLPGHGDPWREGIRSATAAARLAPVG